MPTIDQTHAGVRHTYLSRQLRDWLGAERTADLVAGAELLPWTDEARWVLSLGLATVFQPPYGPTVVAPDSRAALARLRADPLQPVCAILDDDHDIAPCPHAHVAPDAIAHDRILARAAWRDLATDDVTAWRGRHAHGTLTLYRDATGDEYAIWSDSEPSVGAAWTVSELVDVAEARRLLGRPAEATE